MNFDLIVGKIPVYVAGGKPSPDTYNAYKNAAKAFKNWLYGRGKDLKDATDTDAAEYVHDMYEANRKRETINQRIAGGRAFYAVAIRIGEFKGQNPFENIHGRVSTSPDTTNYFTLEEMKSIFEACETDRERLMILLMGVEGLRTVEVERMEISDYDAGKQRVRIHGKGGTEAYIYPSQRTIETLVSVIGKRVQGHVFINEIDGAPLTRSGIKYIVNHIFRMAGVKKRGVSCHTLRHSCGTNLYAATKDLRLVQDTLRHKNPQTTARYTHTTNRKSATETIANF